MKIISKFILYFFIAVLLFSSAGGYFVLYVLQQANYTYIHMADNGKSNVDVFKVSIESYKSNRQYEKEFFQDDKWYDVVKTEIKNDFVFLYCHRDRFEECILGAIDGLFKKGNNHPQSKQEVKLFFAFSITPVSAYIFLNDEKGESLFCKESIQLTYCFKGVASPPPKA